MKKKKPSKTDEFFEEMYELNEKALYPTDLKEAIIGYVERFGQDPLILVDKQKCMEIYMKRDKMSYEDASEYSEFNVIGAWMGERTPCFATLL